MSSRIRILAVLTNFMFVAACAGSLALNGILVTPANPGISIGATQQFAAIGYYNDETTRDITSQVTWTSSNPAVAIIDSSGLATAVSAGTSTITATASSIPSSVSHSNLGSTTIYVYLPSVTSIVVAPAGPVNPSIPAGVNQQFTATAFYSDGTIQNITTEVTWTSSNPAVATINSSGLATALAAGSTTIAASALGASGSAILTVNTATLANLTSLSVASGDPSLTSLPIGIVQQLRAIGNYSDGTSFEITTQVGWSSSNLAIASVNATGLAASVSAGTAYITATSGGISASMALTVNSATLNSISVAPINPRMAAGTTQQFIAIGAYSDATNHDITGVVTWSSSNASVATITSNPSVAIINNSGIAAAVAAGTSTIYATFGGISGNTLLTVD
jgi:uncharacterized protein YjdB